MEKIFKMQHSDYWQISDDLENYNILFSTFWKIGKPVFTEEIDTAAIAFDQETGEFLQFLFSESYWNKIDNYTRMFTICHEILHVFLNHGQRSKNQMKENQDNTNYALDLVINHLLVNIFGFYREKIQNWQDFCWVDTIWPNKSVSDKETFEFYYALLMNDSNKKSKRKTVDDHSWMKGDFQELLDDIKNHVINEYNSMSSEDQKKFKEEVEKLAGTQPIFGGETLSVKPSINMKWVHLMKKKKPKRPGLKEKMGDHWVGTNRRFESLHMSDLMLPTEKPLDSKQGKKRHNVHIFLDTSGSCQRYSRLFMKSALSFPQKYFETHLLGFTTSVYEIKHNRIYNGGTSFSCIERYLQKLDKYPEHVFVLSDGAGDTVYAKYPERWHWFLVSRSDASTLKRYVTPEHQIDFLHKYIE